MIRLWNRQHPIKSIFKIIIVIALVCLCLFLIYMVFRENYRHHELDTSINKLQTHLKQNGIDAKKTSGCGRPYVEFGRGHKSCAISLSTNKHIESLQQANLLFSQYSTTLYEDKGFQTNSPLLNELPDVQNDIDFGSVYYEHTATDKECTMNYEYSAQKNLLQIQFGCNDTSWFVRTFE